MLHPVLVGLLWMIIGICCGHTEVNKKETNQVYSYTYHFQHNGSTDPKQFIQSFLADTPDGGSAVRTFSNPNFRGFVSKGFLPGGPSGFDTGFRTRNTELEGIKKIVENNFKELKKPTSPLLPPEPAPKRFPNVDLEVNNLINNVNDRLKNVDRGSPQVSQQNNNLGGNPRNQIFNIPQHSPVVTRVQEFEKDIPNGKVYEKVETYSFNPPPTSNVIRHTERMDGGVRHHEELNQQNRQGFGHRTVSYFKKEFRTGVPQRDFINNQSPIDELRRHGGNQFNSPLEANKANHNRERSFFHESHNARNANFANHNNINRVFNQFGSRVTQPRNVNIHNPHSNLNNVNQPNGNRESFNNRLSQNHQIGEFNHPNGLGQIKDNRADKADSILKNVNERLKEAHQRLSNIDTNAGFSWDDDNKDWQRAVENNNRDWKRIVNNHHSNWNNVLPPQITNRFNNPNRRQFSNGHSGSPPVQSPEVVVNPVGPQSVDALRSTIEALVGAKLDIPSFPLERGNGNFRNLDGGGLERVFHFDRVVEGPNSFSRNQHRAYERNFEFNSNGGHSRSNQWSTNTVRRLDTQSSSNDFSKDFIDVFNDDN